MFARLALNLFAGWFRLSRWFPQPTMRRIRDAIATGELAHAGELCLAIESRYSIWAVFNGLSPKERARQVFSLLRVWDTRENSGVLLYLQLAERKVELVADRGIAARVDPNQWQALCQQLSVEMGSMPADQAVLRCLERINALLTLHFPADRENPRELPDEPVVL